MDRKCQLFIHSRTLKITVTLIIMLLSSSVFCQHKKIDSLLTEARKLKKKGNNTKSINFVKEAISLDEANYTLNIILGSSYHDIAEFENAINQFNIAEKIDNTKWELYNNKGNSYSRLGNYKLANENLQKALRMEGCPQDTLLYNIANNYWRMGELDEALVYFDKVISYNPKIEEAQSNKAYVYLLKKDYTKAQMGYEKLLQKKPNTYNVLNNLGYIYLKQGDIEKAFLYVNKSLKINPKNSWGYRNLGLIYKEKSDSENACINLNKALELEFIKFWGESDIKELIDYCK